MAIDIKHKRKVYTMSDHNYRAYSRAWHMGMMSMMIDHAGIGYSDISRWSIMAWHSMAGSAHNVQVIYVSTYYDISESFRGSYARRLKTTRMPQIELTHCSIIQ